MSDIQLEPASVDDLEAEPIRRSGPRAVIERLVKMAFGVAVLVFAVVYVADNWTKLRTALVEANPTWIVVAFVVAGVGQWAAMFGFRAVLATSSGRELPVIETARVYFVSQLGKYVPGSVWPIVALIEMCRRHGISRRAAAVAGFLSLALSLLTATLVGVLLVVVGVGQRNPELLWLLLLVPPVLAMLHPRVSQAVIAWVLRVTRRQPLPMVFGRRWRTAVWWTIASWLLLGTQCWLLVVAVGGPVLGSLAASIGGFSLAYAAGAVVVPAPGGAGVREAVLGIALADVIGHSSSFTHDQVVVVVLLSRILLVVLDFGQAGVVSVLARRRRASGPIPARAATEA